MTLVLAAIVGTLFAAGTFLLLRRDLVHVVWGLTILSQGANVYLLSVAGIAAPGPDAVPVLEGHHEPWPETADPLVQALVLTAIVISFGMTAFALTLTYRVYEEHGTIEATELRGEPSQDRQHFSEPTGASESTADDAAAADGDAPADEPATEGHSSSSDDRSSDGGGH